MIYITLNFIKFSFQFSVWHSPNHFYLSIY